MNNITACIITNNNPNVIKAIESVYDSVSEIVLVHTTEDGDVKFPSKWYKVKNFFFKWNDSFSDARNYALSKATGDWILKIDSDEVMSEPINIKLSNDYDFYSFKVMNGQFPAKDIRIFKNGMDIKYSGMVHETVEGHIHDMKKVCTINDITFIHYGLEDEKTLQEKIERNFRILQKDIDNPLRDYHFCNLYYGKQEYEKCIEYGLKVMDNLLMPPIAKGNTCIQMYESYLKLGKTELEYLYKSLILIPVQVYARYRLLEYMWKDKQYDLMLKELNNISIISKLKNSNLPCDINISEEVINEKIKEIKKCQDSRNISELKAAMSLLSSN